MLLLCACMHPNPLNVKLFTIRLLRMPANANLFCMFIISVWTKQFCAVLMLQDNVSAASQGKTFFNINTKLIDYKVLCTNSRYIVISNSNASFHILEKSIFFIIFLGNMPYEHRQVRPKWLFSATWYTCANENAFKTLFIIFNMHTFYWEKGKNPDTYL